MDYFNNVITMFLCLNCGSCIAVYAGSEISQISSMDFHFNCVLKINEGLTSLDRHEGKR